MNNDQLKKYLKDQINLNIEDCLDDIKCQEVEVLPCTLKHHVCYGKIMRYGLYCVLGLSILGSSSYTAYNYVTPETFINIEITPSKASLNTSVEPEDITMQVNLNGYDKVINVSSTYDLGDDINIHNMDYKDAYPVLMNYIKDTLGDDKTIIFTVISNDMKKTFSIEEVLKAAEDHFVHVNDIAVDKGSSLSIGQQKAIELILRKDKNYKRSELEKMSLKELLDILFKL